jgi:hypothetical protein
LPGGIQVSGAWQSIPGAALYANYVATNAVIAPSLGRNLAAGANSSVTLNIVQQGTSYLPRFYQFDVRLSKDVPVGAVRIKAMVDLYNAMNSNAVITANNTYGTTGAAWQVPQVIMAGRLLKLGAQISF